MTENHKHCLYCGINIPQGDMFCSIQCQDSYRNQREKVVKTQRIMMITLVFIFALALFLNLR